MFEVDGVQKNFFIKLLYRIREGLKQSWNFPTFSGPPPPKNWKISNFQLRQQLYWSQCRSVCWSVGRSVGPQRVLQKCYAVSSVYMLLVVYSIVVQQCIVYTIVVFSSVQYSSIVVDEWYSVQYSSTVVSSSVQYSSIVMYSIVVQQCTVYCIVVYSIAVYSVQYSSIVVVQQCIVVVSSVYMLLLSLQLRFQIIL